MRVAGITPESFVDGPGLRIVVFAQGCPLHCPHCQNPDTWDSNAGEEMTVRQLFRILRQHRKNKQGLTLSGGDPFAQAAEFAETARTAHQYGWDVVTYTGYTYEDLIANTDNGIQALLRATDILIDGKYIHALRDIGLRFRGSSNQRVIDMAATRESGRVVLWGG